MRGQSSEFVLQALHPVHQFGIPLLNVPICLGDILEERRHFFRSHPA